MRLGKCNWDTRFVLEILEKAKVCAIASMIPWKCVTPLGNYKAKKEDHWTMCHFFFFFFFLITLVHTSNLLFWVFSKIIQFKRVLEQWWIVNENCMLSKTFNKFQGSQYFSLDLIEKDSLLIRFQRKVE